MGWGRKFLVAFLGLAAFGFGLWPIGLLCFAYLLFSFRPRGRGDAPATELHAVSRHFPFRILTAASLFVLAGAAYASGGTFSPVVLAALAILTLSFRRLRIAPFANEVAPVDGSILVRNRFLSIRWHALAEVKPGSEDIARAMSSFTGRIVVSMVGGPAVFVVFSVFALSRRSAEKSVVFMMRGAAKTLSPSGAGLLPVDSEHLPSFLFQRLRGIRGVENARIDMDELDAGVLVLESRSGLVKAMAAYASPDAASGRASLPPSGGRLSYTPHLWEVLESIGRRHPWAGPDASTGLVTSLQATRGEPMAERLARLEGTGTKVRVKSLGGEELELSRPQFRAITEIYH